MSRIKVAIADDHPMVITGLKNMLSQYDYIELVGTYVTGASLLHGLQTTSPDVLLLDIQLPDKTGHDLAPYIIKHYPDLRMLALTNLDSILHVYNMLRVGVLGYLLKTANQETLIAAIDAVYNRQEFLELPMKEKLAEFTSRMRREARIKATLSIREKEVLQLIVNGQTTTEIAGTLHLGVRTVESYRFNILLKLNVKNTATLVKKAVELGLVH